MSMPPRPTETVGPEPESGGPSPLAIGTRLDGRYRIGAVLGVGGYGVVYRACDEESGRSVAIKALRAERLTASVRQRLRREASLLAGLEHPHLVQVFAAGEADGVAYLTMELVEGESLRDRLLRGQLPLAESVRITREILLGLASLHERGIVHRDVKPGNVLLDEAGRAKLADFGLVRRFESDATWATSSLAVIGTAEYLSPEQALGEDLDGRTDLYSLGVVLFEMLSGRPVHDRRSTFALVLAHLNQPTPDVRELRAETPSWLAGVLERLLEKRRERRYASAAEALADLDAKRLPQSAVLRRLARLGRGTLLALAALAVLSGAAAWIHHRAGFASIGQDAESSAVALDRAGRVLWRRAGVRRANNFVALRTPFGPRLAAILAPDDGSDAAARHRLALLDPLSGAEREVVDLPDAGPRLFGELANRFLWTVHAFDTDRDGFDEVYVAYHHETLWPSYVDIYDPARRRAGTVFAASGHHRPFATADVDDNGRRELLLLGTANRMGWYTGLAAVRVAWTPGADMGDGTSYVSASTPDSDRIVEGGRNLVWYALLPPGIYSGGDAPIAVDESARRLRIHYVDGRELDFGFDGFAVAAATSGLEPTTRAATRLRAYESMRAATRQLEAGRAADAVGSIAAMRRDAEAAGDPLLAEWGDRLRVRALVAAGRVSEAEALASSLAVRSAAGLGVAMEAAQAFHLAGELDRALVWYERGLADSDRRAVARRCWEYLEGSVLVLAEQRRWSEIPAACRKAEAIDPTSVAVKAETYAAWARWRAGLAPTEGGAAVVARPQSPDLVRALRLEIEAHRGGDPAAWLAEVERERNATTETGFLLLSLRGELLARLGRLDEARLSARAALAEARERAGREVVARAFLPDLEERVERLEQRRATSR